MLAEKMEKLQSLENITRDLAYFILTLRFGFKGKFSLFDLNHVIVLLNAENKLSRNKNVQSSQALALISALSRKKWEI